MRINGMKEFFIAEIYERAMAVYNTKEEALENAWMNDEENVIHVIEKSAYDTLKEKYSSTCKELGLNIKSFLELHKENQSLRARVEELEALYQHENERHNECRKSWNEQADEIQSLHSKVSVLETTVLKCRTKYFQCPGDE